MPVEVDHCLDPNRQLRPLRGERSGQLRGHLIAASVCAQGRDLSGPVEGQVELTAADQQAPSRCVVLAVGAIAVCHREPVGGAAPVARRSGLCGLWSRAAWRGAAGFLADAPRGSTSQIGHGLEPPGHAARALPGFVHARGPYRNPRTSRVSGHRGRRPRSTTRIVLPGRSQARKPGVGRRPGQWGRPRPMGGGAAPAVGGSATDSPGRGPACLPPIQGCQTSAPATRPPTRRIGAPPIRDGRNRRRRSAFETTVTDDRAMAAAAKIGSSRIPVNG